MRVAQVAPLWECIPPCRYGGTERVIYNLVEGLIDRGHDVTLFASGDSRTRAELVPIVPRNLRAGGIPWDNHIYPLMSFAAAFERAAEFDVIHTHLNTPTDYVIFPFARLIQTPTLTTVHCRLPSAEREPDRHAIVTAYRDHRLITISDAQRAIPGLTYVETVYNGIDVEAYRFSATPEDYVVWLARICDDKGTREAIAAARQAGVKLCLAGKLDVHNPEYMAYYEREVVPHVDGDQVVFLGEIDQRYAARLLRGARALLNPIKWPEPFGLAMAEAMACGTPVIAFPNGSAPELIEDGVTGFIVEDVDEMAAAIGRLDQIDRRACRRHVETCFSSARMVDDYERVYRQLATRAVPDLVTDQELAANQSLIAS